MKLKYRLLILVLALTVVAATWVAWNWPRRVDMAQYAPADSIIYLECNNVVAVTEGITGSDAWKRFAASLGLRTRQSADRWLYLAASLGLAPAQSVILSRAQVAVVMLNLDAAEENSTLSIKPEGAIIIETHTAGWRTKPAAEAALQQFAERMYGPVTAKHSWEDADYLEWSPAAGDRKIVAVIDGSLVVVGNSKRAVQKCLEARRKPESSLRDDAALRQMRAKMGSSQSLTFGYVSAGNATRLVSWAAPLLFGREPGDSTLEQIVARNAARILGSIGWSSRAVAGGIEDRFFLTLEPSVVSRLRPAFRTSQPKQSVWTVAPGKLEAITVYKSQTPADAWNALRAVSSQFDALSAVFFGSVMNSALLPYGIANPDKFLNAVGPEVATLKVSPQSEGSVLIARALDRPALEQMFKTQRSRNPKDVGTIDFELADAPDKEFAAAFLDDYFLVGGRDDVRACVDARSNGQTVAGNGLTKPATLAVESKAAIVTYSNDAERVRGFLSAVGSLRAVSANDSAAATTGEEVPFATTETNLEDQGLDRRTRSAFGQFSTLVGLLKHE